MKNVIYILAVMACIGMIVFGVMQKSRKDAQLSENNNAPTVASAVPVSPSAPVTTAGGGAAIPDNASIISSTPISGGTTHYRPDQPVVSSSSAAAKPADAEQTFIITPEIVAKKYLVDKYKIGTCFGSPVVVPEIAIQGLVTANPPFSTYLRQAYGLKTDLEVYNKIKQFQTIDLTETASSIYKYVFSDGQCQTVSYQEGIVTVSRGTATDTVTVQQSHTY